MITLDRLQALGGATLDSIEYEPIQLKSGYMVGISGYETVRHIDYIDDYIFSQFIMGKKIDIGIKTFNALGIDAYVGVWYDTYDKGVYIDLSINIDNLDTALKVARLHNQKAIYDCANKCDIELI